MGEKMDLVLIMIIVITGIAVFFMGTTAFFGYKYFLFRTKTPAAEYLKARKKKTPLAAKFYEDGGFEVIASNTKEFIDTGKENASIAPLSTFTDLKTRQPITCWFASPGISGQTMSPKTLVFTNEVRKLMREENISQQDAIQRIMSDSEGGSRYVTEYGPISFADIPSYMNYNDAKSNLEQANHQANLMRGMDRQMIKIIMLIIAGGVVIIGIIAAIWLIGKYGFGDAAQVDVKLTAETLRQAMQSAGNSTAIKP